MDPTNQTPAQSGRPGDPAKDPRPKRENAAGANRGTKGQSRLRLPWYCADR
ncbi:hypothetical protein [Lamprocystis purpurea]|uniref:hypothetical protein n=1 Tax=Lamprocystis purpurea TaxID=61598 RepID=UPI00146D9515|nr:hypothetical protein [Lamprocystis purpurea]